MGKPKLHIHIKGATHFLDWELPEFRKYFELVSTPSSKTLLLSFGPDALEEAAQMPASKRYAVLFPGFLHNPIHNPDIRELHRKLINKSFELAFINPGPLQIAYEGLRNVRFYPFSVDTSRVICRSYRTAINSLLHVSNDGPQKDWQRSSEIMKLTGLRNEVFPPRKNSYYKTQVYRNRAVNVARRLAQQPPKNFLPYGYVDHQKVIKKYQRYDGFVHVAAEIKHPNVIDGKYTASLIEAGVTGAILFWHDTFSLGNNLNTVFSLSLEPKKAAEEILEIRKNINVFEHSQRTREEMLDTFNPEISVRVRAQMILERV